MAEEVAWQAWVLSWSWSMARGVWEAEEQGVGGHPQLPLLGGCPSASSICEFSWPCVPLLVHLSSSQLSSRCALSTQDGEGTSAL